jgi:hypothetical protein
MVGCASRIPTAHDMPRANRFIGRSADATEPVPVAPIRHAARVGEYAGLLRRQLAPTIRKLKRASVAVLSPTRSPPPNSAANNTSSNQLSSTYRRPAPRRSGRPLTEETADQPSGPGARVARLMDRDDARAASAAPAGAAALRRCAARSRHGREALGGATSQHSSTARSAASAAAALSPG